MAWSSVQMPVLLVSTVLFICYGVTGQGLLFLANCTGTLLEAWIIQSCYSDIWCSSVQRGRSSSRHLEFAVEVFSRLFRTVLLVCYTIDPLPVQTVAEPPCIEAKQELIIHTLQQFNPDEHGWFLLFYLVRLPTASSNSFFLV